MKFLKKLINIKSGEGKMVLTFFLFSFFTIGMGLIAKTAKDAYFLSRFEKSTLPLMFLAVALAIAPVLTIYTKLSKKLSSKILFIGTSSLFFTSLIALQPLISGWVIPATYIWIEVIVAVTIIQFWTFAGDSFQPQQAKRLFGIIAGGGSFAVMLIGMNLKPFVNAFGTDELLFLAAGFLILSFVFGLKTLKFFKKDPVRKSSISSKKTLKKKKMDPFILGISGIVSLSAIVSVLVDYQFKMIASNTFTSEAELVSFFGLFYSIAGAASIIMQFFITGPVLSRFGILVGITMLPIFLIAGSAVFLFVPILLSATFAKFSDQTFKFTINGSSLELLWLPVPADVRKTIKPQVSGTIKSVAEGFGGLITFFLAKIISLQYLSVVSIGAIIIWLFGSLRVRTAYIKQLETAISKRQIDFEELNIDVQDAAMVKTIEETLGSKDEIKQLFAFEIIEGLPLHSWKNTIKRLFNEGSPEVRKRILSLAWDEEDIISDDDIVKASLRNDEVSPEAIETIGKRKLSNTIPQLEELLNNESIEIQASAAAAILQIGASSTEKAKSILNNMLEDKIELTRATALKRLINNDSLITKDKLASLLREDGNIISNVALKIAELRNDADLIPDIISNLADSRTSLQARDTLRKFSEDETVSQYEGLLVNGDTSRKLKMGIIKALRDFPDNKSAEMLIGQLNNSDQDIYNEVVDSLLAIARINPIAESKKEIVSNQISVLAEKLYSVNESIKMLPNDANKVLLSDHLNNEIQNTLPTLLKLGVIYIPDTPIETYIQTIKSGDPSKLPFLLEFFENIFSNEERKIINPLIENIPVEERSQIGKNYFKNLPNSLDSELSKSAASPNKWESVIALDYLFKSKKLDTLRAINWNQLPLSSGNQELLTRIKKKNEFNIEFIPFDRFKLDEKELNMYSTLEKTIILKSVDLFNSIPAENLSRVAQITEEVRYDANVPIIAEGDYGDSLFIVVDGNVKVHKGDKEITRMGKGSCIGDMALLDGEPRSADVTATEESTLFKIEQEGFYEVMGSHGDIMEAIIKNLSSRVRNMNEQLYSK